MFRVLKWLVILALIGGAAAVAASPVMRWWKKSATPKYTTAKVTRGRVETAVNCTGTVKATRTVTVGSFVSGPITKVYVDYNSPVTRDMPLADIDPRLFQAAANRDQATLDTQKAEKSRVEALLRQARNNMSRGQQLRKINKDYLSDTEWDQLEANHETLLAQLKLVEAGIKQATANLENSKTNLEYTKVKAPPLRDGESAIVLERKVDDGQTVASQFQTPEMFILAIDLDKKVHVYATVDEADIGHITAAQKHRRPVRFTVDAYPHDLFEGAIFQVRKNSTTTQNVVTYPVVIEAKNPGMKLMPGMTASLSFLVEAKEGALRVPSAAMRFVPEPKQVRPEDRHYIEGGPSPQAPAQPDSGVRLSAQQKADLAKARTRRIVWVKDGELLRAVPITLGLMDTQWAEVLTGELKEDDELVTGLEAPAGGRR